MTDTYIIVQWPESQKYMEDFVDQIELVNNPTLVEIYGNSAYFVPIELTY